MKDTGVMNQSQICKLVKAELGIKYIGKIVSLLKKGEGKYWNISPTGLKKFYALHFDLVCRVFLLSVFSTL